MSTRPYVRRVASPVTQRSTAALYISVRLGKLSLSFCNEYWYGAL
jgi:hypothetical protein